MNAREKLKALDGGKANGARGTSNATDPYGVLFDDKGKMLLPEIPEHDDAPGLCKWLTAVLNLDRSHPITRGIHEGLRGPDGHVILERADAVSIRFEPASKINNPTRMIEALSWWKQPTDGLVHSFKADHCRQISHVVRMLCGAHCGMTEAQQTEAIIGDLMQAAIAVTELTTYGTPGQRYEAAVGLRRERDELTGRSTGPPRYLIDTNTGEMVFAVSDLAEAARRHVGSSLPRGWLDARMEDLDWTRITIDGHQIPGQAGRQGPHARVFAYRGHLSAITDDQDDQPDPQDPVTT